jgi:hypothetical protein
MPPSKSCGQHTELASNATMRVTRCGCGTMHVTLIGSGVTVRMSAEALRGLATGLSGAVEKLEEQDGSGLGGATIN